MKQNVGKADKIVRVLVGLAVLGIGWYYGSWWGAVGIVPIFTAAIGWCPGYLPFGMSTCKTDIQPK
jgi:hypothetical protein